MSNDLYHEQIIERAKRSDNNIRLENPDCSATVSNPLCGDRITVELKMEGDVIKAISGPVKGCVLCKASASILAEIAVGMKCDELKSMASDLGQALKSQADNNESFPKAYRMFYPVKKHKSRHSCVMLPLEGALKAISECKGHSGDK
ncbi:MAG: iron-sulfur cluster assembly scaffold protein [Deltaproteobacteria bacterium]|nr:iron-sulfur cluster assembly scaffold protein [Deltaproteobacteria bacterium]